MHVNFILESTLFVMLRNIFHGTTAGGITDRDTTPADIEYLVNNQKIVENEGSTHLHPLARIHFFRYSFMTTIIYQLNIDIVKLQVQEMSRPFRKDPMDEEESVVEVNSEVDIYDKTQQEREAQGLDMVSSY